MLSLVKSMINLEEQEISSTNYTERMNSDSDFKKPETKKILTLLIKLISREDINEKIYSLKRQLEDTQNELRVFYVSHRTLERKYADAVDEISMLKSNKNDDNIIYPSFDNKIKITKSEEFSIINQSTPNNNNYNDQDVVIQQPHSPYFITITECDNKIPAQNEVFYIKDTRDTTLTNCKLDPKINNNKIMRVATIDRILTEKLQACESFDEILNDPKVYKFVK
jgi:hypothetical protein